jgi:NADH dehydrogenase
MEQATTKKVIIAGGGFAGINLIKKLCKDNRFQVTLVDKNNYHFFPPLLYQVSTAFIEPSSISYPFRKLFRNKGIKFRMAEMIKVDPGTQTIYLNDGGELTYDHLVFAAGAKTNFFGNEAIQEKAISLKGIDDALHMRNELIKTMEKAAIEKDPAERKKLMTIVITGGGPTGVEVAGMLAEMSHFLQAAGWILPGNDEGLPDLGKNMLQ